MRRFFILVFLSLAAAPAVAQSLEGPRSLYREGEILVKYRDDADGADATELKSRLGLESQGRLIDRRHESLKLPSITRVESAIEMLRAEHAVEYAEPNYLRFKKAAPTNDPLFSEQWGLSNTGQANFVPGGDPGVVGGDIHMPAAWSITTGDGSVTVAVLDNGVLLSHQDLSPNLVAGRSFNVRNGANGSGNGGVVLNDTNHDHGTLVAGCIGAVGNNGIGVAGVAWDVKLMPLQFDFSIAAEAHALAYAVAHGAQIVNGSFGGPEFSKTEHDAIVSLEAADVLFVVAAGNEDSNTDYAQLAYPANYDLPNIVAVAATNRQDNIASFSTYGPTTVAVSAPGLQIVTTSVDGGYSTNPNDVAGTSFATPYTAGVAALLDMHAHQQSQPFLHYQELKARLIEGADPGLGTAFGTSPDARRTIGGRVNAANSLSIAPRPSITIKSFDFTAPLDSNTTPTVDLVIGNDWIDATSVVTTLHASTNPSQLDNADVTITSGSSASIDLVSGDTAPVSFTLAVANGLTQHKYVYFTLHIAATGYSADRHFIGEIGTLQSGVGVTQALGSDIYDEFQTWHYTALPGTASVSFQTSGAPFDIDLLAKLGAPARYQIELGCSPKGPNGSCVYCTSDTTASCQDPATKVGRSSGANETLTFSNAAPGVYYATVVNYGDPESDTGFNYRIQATAVPQKLALRSATYSAAKTDGSATITLSRSVGSRGAVSVQLATSDGTATAGTNYTATTTPVNFADGASSATATIPLLDDPNQTDSKTVNLTLSNPSGAAILGTQSTAVLTITPAPVPHGGGGGGGPMSPATLFVLTVVELLRRRRAISTK